MYPYLTQSQTPFTVEDDAAHIFIVLGHKVLEWNTLSSPFFGIASPLPMTQGRRD